MGFGESGDTLRAAAFTVALMTALSIAACTQPSGSSSTILGADVEDILASPAGLIPVPTTQPEGFVVAEVEAVGAHSISLVDASGDTIRIRTPDAYISPESFTFGCDDEPEATYCAVHDTNQPPLSKVIVVTEGTSATGNAVMTAIGTGMWTYARHATWLR